MHRTKHNKQAFSLVELAIVLVILGLLAGGVLSGTSLIRAAELRSVATNYTRYATATQSFRDKYLALPGDMPNAIDFWTAAHATAATCVTTASTGKETCNGDGDGKINLSTGSNEPFRFWQQLANAGLIEGTYSGVATAAAPTMATNANSPSGKLGNSLWMPFYFGSLSAAGDIFFDGQYDNTLLFGGIVASASPSNGILRPEEIWNLDTKLDDGKPATGKVVVRAKSSSLAACTNATGSTAAQAATLTADYLLSSSAVVCTVAFRQLF